MSTYAVRQSVKDRRALEVGIQDAKALHDVRKIFVSDNGLGEREIRRVGQQDKLAVEEF